MNDLDHLLRDAGTRLRDAAPSAEATEVALAGLDDVVLDDVRPTRNRLWVIAPALVAAAAAIVGIVVLTRSTDEAITPTDPTVVATTVTPTTTPTTTPAIVPTPIVPPVSTAAPTTATPTTTPATVPGEVELLAGVRLRTTDVDFDASGGACLTVVTATAEVRGCAGGATMRGTYGEPLRFRLDGVPSALFPNGIDGSGRPELVVASTTATPCFLATDLPGQMVEGAGCGDDGVGIVGALPTTPDRATTWTIVGTDRAPEGGALDLLVDSEVDAARVFRSRETPDQPPCLVVTGRTGLVGEACFYGARSILAGTGAAPLLVEHDPDAGTTVVRPLDPATVLAASGCPDLTVGDLLGLLPSHGTVSGLLCGGAAGAATRPPALLHDESAMFVSDAVTVDVLARNTDGRWAVRYSDLGLACTEVTSAEVCGVIGITELSEVMPFPGPDAITAFDEALAGGAALTSRLATDDFPTLPSAPSLDELGTALVADLRTIADPEQRIEVVGSSSPIVIRQTNLDDSVTATIYVVTTATIPTGETVVIANVVRAFDVCGRRLATADGQTVCL